MKIASKQLEPFCKKCRYQYELPWWPKDTFSVECCADLENGFSKTVIMLWYKTDQGISDAMVEVPLSCPYRLELLIT